jgi:hypothetical protein
MTPRTRRLPVLGWLSIANAGVVCALVVAIPSIVVARSAVEESGGVSIGVVGSGMGSSALMALAIDFALGVVSALIGVLRGEQPKWLHGLGVSLNLGAPGLGLVLLRIIYY